MPNPRKPRKTKIIHGTFRKDRNPKHEPEPTEVSSIPKPPSHLNRYAKKLWKSLAAELVDKGLLTVIDLAALEVCCAAYGEYRAAYDACYRPRDPETGRIRKREMSEYMAGGNSQTLPEHTTIYKAWNVFKAYLAEFGMAPASRNKIDLPEPKEPEEDPVEKMFNEKG
jgi:P27 family predicted phage terminase small subunit